MKQQFTYTQNLYELVQKQSKTESKGRIKLNFSNPEHHSCMVGLFGGEEAMKAKFPHHHAVMANTLKSNHAVTKDTTSSGFVDFSRIEDIFYAKNEKELSTYSYANLAGAAQTIYLTVTVYRAGKQIDFNSGFSYSTSHANIKTLSKNITPIGGENDDIEVILHVSWQKNNLMYSEVSYDLRNSREYSLTEIIKDINVIHPRNIKSPADSPITVTFGRTGFYTEALDYEYESVRKENLQMMFLEIKGEATLVDGAKFVKGHPIETDIVLNHAELGTIFYAQTIPEGSIVKIENNKFKWKIDYDWENKIPSSIYATIREYAFDMSLSFSAIRPGESEPSKYSIEITSFDKPANPHCKKINRIELRWGCLAEDSIVRMADGSEKRIQEISIGDMVKAPDGKPQQVVNIWTGTEERILHIETKGKKKIRLTETHPLMTKDGLKPAIVLTFEDLLLMEDGNYEAIENAYALPYGQKVYNLDLEEEHTFVCDGFVVGDNQMQNTVLASNSAAGCKEPLDEEMMREIKELEIIHHSKEKE